MGFSLTGLVVSLAVLAPNLLLLRFPPRDGSPSAEMPALLAWAERAGQALCLVVPAIGPADVLAWWWAVPVVAGLAGYYALWGRYLLTGRRVMALYWWRSVRAPMALLPVAVFFSAAVWLSSPWVAVAAAVLAAGHLPVAMITARAVKGAQ